MTDRPTPAGSLTATTSSGAVDDLGLLDAAARTRATQGHDGGALLADALSGNAVFAAATGLVAALGAPWIAGVLDLPWWLLVGLGAGLLGFAWTIMTALARPSRLRAAARSIVVADVAWVAGAVLLLALDAVPSAATGALVATTVVVAGLATAQVAGLRRAASTPDADLGARAVALSATRTVAASPATVWSLVSDVAGYAAFAPGLAEARTDGPLDLGMQRVCVDERGDRWSEAVTALDEGRGYAITVDTTTYPLHYRLVLHTFGMAWDVQPDPTGARMTLTFGGSVLLGLFGRLAMALLARDAPHETIVERYADAALAAEAAGAG